MNAGAQRTFFDDGDANDIHYELSAVPHVYCGTSSWNFEGWEGLIYPVGEHKNPSDKMLGRYSQHAWLNAVGVDHSYYRAPNVETWERYHQQVPADFQFLVKVPKIWTRPDSEPETFLDERELLYFCEAVQRGLGNKLGAVLLQLSPGCSRYINSAELIHRMQPIVRACVESKVPLALELRDQVYYAREQHVTEALNGIIPVVLEHPAAPMPRRQFSKAALLESPTLVIRWMLHRSESYQSAKDQFAPFDQIIKPADDVLNFFVGLLGYRSRLKKKTIVIANNKAEGSSPLSIQRLLGRLQVSNNNT